jgi:replicative DNA helicase
VVLELAPPIGFFDDAPATDREDPPPHDHEAERKVLGSVLYDEERLSEVRELRPGQLHSEAHRQVWTAILALAEQARSITVETVSDQLRLAGRLSQVGPGYVLELVALTAVYSKRQLADVLGIVLRTWRERQEILIAERLQAQVRAGIGGAGATAVAELQALYPPQNAPALTVRTPEAIVRAWRDEGQLVRVPTGFRSLDDACRGGLPIPWRVYIVGPPSAGKTALGMVLVRNLATDGELCMGVLGVDEEPDEQNVRVAQMCGFTIAQCEGRDPLVLEEMALALKGLRIRFYDASHTIEQAADDLAAWGASENRRCGLLLDTVQTVRCGASVDAKGPRELVEANVRAIRAKGAEHRMLMVGLSEANRGAYRSDDTREQGNDLAAAKESSAIEYSAQIKVMVRTPKGHADHVRVHVTKNRRGARADFEFFLHLDRDRHRLTECSDPTDAPEQVQEREGAKRAKNRGHVAADALALAAVVRQSPGIGERGLRAAIRLAGHVWGRDRLDAAKRCLTDGLRGERLVNRGTGQGCRYHLDGAPDGGES